MNGTAKGFPCPNCKGPTRVLDTRSQGDELRVRRYRCVDATCHTGFSTFEVLRDDTVGRGDRRAFNVAPPVRTNAASAAAKQRNHE